MSRAVRRCSTGTTPSPSRSPWRTMNSAPGGIGRVTAFFKMLPRLPYLTFWRVRPKYAASRSAMSSRSDWRPSTNRMMLARLTPVSRWRAFYETPLSTIVRRRRLDTGLTA
jgi:hypothetical protein